MMSDVNESRLSLEDAMKIQMKARQYVKQEQYEEALVLLQEALRIKKIFLHIPPYVCAIDIVMLHLEIGNISRSLRCAKLAMTHFQMAWSLCRDQYGNSHPLTQDAQRQCFITAHDSPLNTTTAAAA